MIHTMKNRSALEIYKEGGAWWETEISHIQKIQLNFGAIQLKSLLVNCRIRRCFIYCLLVNY